MDEKDDEQVLRDRIFDLKTAEVRQKIEKLKKDRIDLLGEPKVANQSNPGGLSFVAIFAIVLTVIVLAVAVFLAVSPLQLKP